MRALNTRDASPVVWVIHLITLGTPFALEPSLLREANETYVMIRASDHKHMPSLLLNYMAAELQ